MTVSFENIADRTGQLGKQRHITATIGSLTHRSLLFWASCACARWPVFLRTEPASTCMRLTCITATGASECDLQKPLSSSPLWDLVLPRAVRRIWNARQQVLSLVGPLPLPLVGMWGKAHLSVGPQAQRAAALAPVRTTNTIRKSCLHRRAGSSPSAALCFGGPHNV